MVQRKFINQSLPTNRNEFFSPVAGPRFCILERTFPIFCQKFQNSRSQQTNMNLLKDRMDNDTEIKDFQSIN